MVRHKPSSLPLLGCVLALVLLSCGCRRQIDSASPVSPKGITTSQAMMLPLTLHVHEIDPGPLLEHDGLVATSLGASPLQVLATGAGGEGDRVGGFVELEQGFCMLAFARGTGAIDDLDILAFAEDGTPLAADQAIDPKPAVVICPPHPNRIYISSRVAAGHGFVAVGVQSMPVPVSARIADVFGAIVAQKERVFAQAWPGLEAAIARRRASLGGRWEELRKVSLPVNPRSTSYLSAPLLASRCLDVLVFSNEETAHIDVTLADETGRDLARVASASKDRAALVCSPIDTTITVGIRPHDGHGMVAVILSRSAPGSESELSVRPDAVRAAPMEPLEKTRARASAQLARAGYDAKTEIATGRVESGRSSVTAFDLAAGCSRIEVMASEPVAGLRATLWSATDDLMATGEGGERLALFGCVKTAQRAQLEVTGVGRSGGYVAELRREKAPPPELIHHPLAASRVLARANAAGRCIGVPSLSEVRRVDVDEMKRAGFDVAVAVGTCLNVVIGLELGATGLKVSAVDAANGTGVDSARGTNVAHLQVCSRFRPMKTHIIVEVSAGKAEGVAAAFVEPIDSH